MKLKQFSVLFLSMAVIVLNAALPDFSNVGRWKANSSGKTRITAIPDEKGIRFESTFSSNGGWTYPQFELSPSECFSQAEAISFEIKLETKTPVSSAYVVLDKEKRNKDNWKPFSMPAAGKWTMVRLPLSPAQVVSCLSIGMNPKTGKCSWMIRNVRFHGTLKEKIHQRPTDRLVSLPDFSNAGRWKANSSGKTRITAIPDEKGIRFESTFSSNGGWTYPQFELSPSECFSQAEAISFEIKLETKTPVSSAYVVLDKEKRNKDNWKPFSMPAAGKWTMVRLPLSPAQVVSCLSIGMNPKTGKCSWMIRNVRFHGRLKKSKNTESPVHGMLQPVAPAGLFFSGEKLQFKGMFSTAVDYRVTDDAGNVVLCGKFPPRDSVVLPSLQNGYYRLRVSEASQDITFAVIPPVQKNPSGKISAYAFDAAFPVIDNQKGNAKRVEQGRSLLIEVCRRIGIRSARGRTAWSTGEPQQGNFSFAKDCEDAASLNKFGASFVGFLDWAPDWARKNRDFILMPGDNNPYNRTPTDLRTLYHFTNMVAKCFGNTMHFCEYLNEPGLKFNPSCEVAAVQKTTYLGLKSGNKNIHVLSPSMCLGGDHPGLKEFLKNDAGSYFDVFNYHCYEPLNRYSEWSGKYRRSLAEFGLTQPVIVSEAGLPFDTEGPAGQASSFEGKRAHTAMQEMIQAEFTIKSQILMQNEGVMSTYSFVLPYYSERGGTKDWGHLRADGSAKPSLCAFAVLTSTLGTAAYLGEYTIPEGRGFLYSLTDGSQVLVLWKSNDIDSGKKNITFHQDSKNIELPLPSGNYILRSFFGADRKLFASENKVFLQLTTLPAYLCLPQNVKLMPTKEVVKVRSPGISESPDIDKSIVIRLVPQQGFSMQRNTFSLLKVISENRLKLEIYNFSKIRKRGRLISSIPLKGLPKEIIVESEGRTDCYTQVVPSEGKSIRELMVSGEFNGKKTTCAATRLFLENCVQSIPLRNWNAPARWRANSSGTMTISACPEENAVRFRTDFKNNKNRWIYPELLLDEPLPKNCIGLRFEMRLDSRTAASGSSNNCVYFVEKHDGGNEVHVSYDPLPDQPQYRTYTVINTFQSQLAAEHCQKLRFGLNPRTDQVEFLIRDIQVLF